MSAPQAKKQTILIGTYTVDATLSEGHTLDSEVTDYPVETGGSITDNVRPKPITVTLEGIVSDTPIGKIADLRNSEGDNGQMDFSPTDDALAALTAIRDAREPITIASSLQSWDNMVMTSLSIPRDSQTGNALRFSATFQQVIFVTNNRVTVRVSAPQNGPSQNLGAKGVKILDTKLILWKKGNPPGAPLPANGYPTERIYLGDASANGIPGQHYYHSDRATPLSTPDLVNFVADLSRDQRTAIANGAFTGTYTPKRLPQYMPSK